MILVVNKQSRQIVDIDQQYDQRFFEHIDVAQNAIEDVANIRSYAYIDGVISPAQPVGIRADLADFSDKVATALTDKNVAGPVKDVLTALQKLVQSLV